MPPRPMTRSSRQGPRHWPSHGSAVARGSSVTSLSIDRALPGTLAASRASTSWRNAVSPAQAASRNARRALAGRSSAPSKSSSSLSQAVAGGAVLGRGGGVSTELLPQPGASRRPAPLHRSGRQIERPRRLLEREPAEDAALHDLRRPLVELPESAEGRVDGEHLLQVEGE